MLRWQSNSYRVWVLDSTFEPLYCLHPRLSFCETISLYFYIALLRFAIITLMNPNLNECGCIHCERFQ